MSAPIPICLCCKVDLSSQGYEVVILKGRLFRKMSCIYCGADTNHLGTIEKVDAKRKVELATA